MLAISSSPKAAPCDEAEPSLLGEPFPIRVLQQIMDGLNLSALASCIAALI